MRHRGPITWPISIGDSATREFDLHFYEFDAGRYVAAVLGDPSAEPVPVRIESACVFGHIFRGRKCDCGDQFETALERMIDRGQGVAIYALDDDARGHGVEMHFKLYELRQHEGRMDEREIFDDLGLELDARDYRPVVEILDEFGIESVELMTNNPERIEVLEANDITVEDRLPIETTVTEYNEKLLLQEKEWLGYETSYRTHDEWVREFQRRREDAGAEVGYLVTSDHASVTDATFADEGLPVSSVGVEADSFSTLYLDHEPPDTLPDGIDKVVRVDGEEWTELAPAEVRSVPTTTE